MSSAQSDTSDDRRSYRKRVLELCTGNDPEALIALRDSEWDLRKRRSDPGYAKEEFLLELASTRERFWESTAADIEKSLGRLDLFFYPNLDQQRQRLLEINSVRDDFEALQRESNCAPPFLALLLKILLSTATEATALKNALEQRQGTYASTYQRAEDDTYPIPHRTKTQDLKDTAAVIRDNYPQIYSLERDWLDHVVAYGRGKSAVTIRENPSLAAAIGFAAGFTSALGTVVMFAWAVYSLRYHRF